MADGSPAAEAGLRAAVTASGALTGRGDVVVRIGERRIDCSEDLVDAIADLRQGDSVEVEVARDGGRRVLEVTLGATG